MGCVMAQIDGEKLYGYNPSRKMVRIQKKEKEKIKNLKWKSRTLGFHEGFVLIEAAVGQFGGAVEKYGNWLGIFIISTAWK